MVEQKVNYIHFNSVMAGFMDAQRIGGIHRYEIMGSEGVYSDQTVWRVDGRGAEI